MYIAQRRSRTARTNGLSTTSAFEASKDYRFDFGGRRDDARAFQRAARHSRRVRLLRWAIPVGIALILGTTVLVTWLDPLRVLVRLPVDHGGLVISGTKITMQAPKLSGYTRDQRWYEVTAKAAGQDITKPDLIELREIRAKIEAQDKSTIDLSAKSGVFNRKASVLTLTQNVVVKTSTGSEMHLDEATIDTGSGEIISNRPVAVFTDQGTLNADRLEVYNSGEVIHFIGGVVMNLNGNDDAKPAEKR
jgi:lipopolysaccharide export system protein LptC